MTAKDLHREQQKNLRAYNKTKPTVPSSKDFGFMDVKSIQILSRVFLEKWAQLVGSIKVTTCHSQPWQPFKVTYRAWERKEPDGTWPLAHIPMTNQTALLVDLGFRVCSSLPFFFPSSFLPPSFLPNVQPASRPTPATLMLYTIRLFRKSVDLFS